MAPEKCKVSVFCYTTAVVLLLSSVNSAAQPLPQNCSYRYLIVPHSQPDCNPVNNFERVDLLCITTVHPMPPTQIYWFWSSNNKSAGVSNTSINHDGIKYFIQEVASADRNIPGFLDRRSRLTIVDFGANDTGYYWCQIVVGCLTRLQPSQPVYLERNDSLVGCGPQGLFTEAGGLCADLDPTSTQVIINSPTPTSLSIPTSSSVATPIPLPPTDSKANKLLVWQLATAGLGTLTILLVLALVGVAIQYARRKRRPDNQQVQLRRAAHIQCLSSALSRHQQTASSDQQTQGQELMLQGIIPSYIDMDRELGDPHLSMERLDQETSEFYSPIEESLDTKYQTLECTNSPAVHYVNIPFNEAARYQPLSAETLDSPSPYTIRVKTLPPTVILKDGGKEYCICDKDEVDRPRVYQLPTQSGSNNHED